MVKVTGSHKTLEYIGCYMIKDLTNSTIETFSLPITNFFG